MVYLIEQLLPYLALAFVVGVVVGWYSLERRVDR